jgi:hypothetical protein
MPKEINHFRIGEAITLGRNVLDRSPWPGTRQDTIRIVAEVIEVECKPSIPIGSRGQDAFGSQVEFVDRGIRKRALCNIGRQDILVDGITPEDPGIIVLGGSSDHLVLDVEEANRKSGLGMRLRSSQPMDRCWQLLLRRICKKLSSRIKNRSDIRRQMMSATANNIKARQSYLADRVATLKPSGIRKFFDIVATMKDVISLGIGG